MIDPTQDGIDHINVYSRANTALGRWMSNFACQPFTIRGKSFQSIEGFWYWMMTGDPRLQHLSGFKAKELGKSLPLHKDGATSDSDRFRRLIEEAIRIKANGNPKMLAQLRATNLPFEHYYVYGDKVVDAGYKWILNIWNNIRKES